MVKVETEDDSPPKYQHKFRIGHGKLKVKNSQDFGGSQSQYERYRIPYKLVEELLIAWELNS